MFEFCNSNGKVFFRKSNSKQFFELCGQIFVKRICICAETEQEFVEVSNSAGKTVLIPLNELHTTKGIGKLSSIVLIHRINYAKSAIVCYLNDLAESCQTIAQIRRRTGWFEGSLAYLMRTGEVLGNSMNLVLHKPQFEYRAAGTLEEWNNQVFTQLLNIPEAIFMVGISLSAPLLKFLNLDSRIFHFFGNSSSGKSVLQSAAASVWGSGDIVRWHANYTYTGLENEILQHNDGVLFVDDMTYSPYDSKTVFAFIHTISSNCLKIRFNKHTNRISNDWFRSICISNGEYSLDQYFADNKLEFNTWHFIRCISIHCDSTKYVDGQTIDNIRKASLTFYGTAARDFINKLSKVSDVSEFVCSRFKKKSGNFNYQNRKISRIAKYFQLALTALDMAIEFGTIKISQQQAQTAILAVWKTWLEKNHGTFDFENLLERIEDFIRSNYRKFIFLNATEIAADNDILGYWQIANGYNYFYILPYTFEQKILGGMNKKKAIEYLKKIGWLIPSKDKNTTRIYHKNTYLGRAYKFKRMLP